MTSPGEVVSIFTSPYLSAGTPALGEAKGLKERKERERQFKIEEEITREIESKIKNLRNEIILFKSNFQNNYHSNKEGYKIYLVELKNLLQTVENRKPNLNIAYPYEEKKELQKTIINNEIKN